MNLRLLGLLMSAVVAAVACSDTTNGGSGSGADAGGIANQQICQGSFCVDADIKIGASPTKLLFADVVAGTATNRSVVISHTGTSGTLTVSAVSFDNFAGEFSVVDFKPFTLAAAGKQTLIVRYNPTTGGTKKLNLILANNATDLKKRQFPVPIEVAPNQALLQANPDPIDFGNVAAKTSPTIEVALTNIGTADMTITGAALNKTGTTDFVIDKMPELDKPIAAGASTPITIRYTPTGGNLDATSLLIDTKDGRKYAINVQGVEIAPVIQVVPPKVDLGEMELNKEVTAEVKLCNIGLAQLDVSTVELATVSQLKTISWDLKAPLAIAGPKTPGTCDTGVKFTLKAKTAAPLPKNGSPIASLIITSNDQQTPSYTLPIFAATNAPKILVTPGDSQDFGFVGKSVKSQKNIEVFNEGSAPLDVTKLSISDDDGKLGEFSVVPGGFAPTNAGTATLDPGKGDAFKVQFESKGPAGQTVKAKLHIASNDPGVPDYVLPLTADRVDGTVCKIAMVPTVLNFGLLPYGSSKSLPLTFKNTGSGVCKFKEVHVGNCKGNGLPPPMGPGPVLTCSLSGSPIWIASAPQTTLFKLGPGDTGKLTVTFAAPESLGAILGKPNEISPFGGLLSATFEDDSNGNMVYAPDFAPTDMAKVAKAAPNLVAKIGKAAVTVLPGQLDFGLVTVGCKSPVQTVSVFNTGSTEAFVNKIELVGCGLEVVPVGWPGIPKTGLPVSQAQPATFKVQYGPQNAGKDQCQLMVYTSLQGACTKPDGSQSGVNCVVNADCTGVGEFCAGQLFSVPIIGEGTLDTEWTDNYEQGTGKQSDVLFVVDNSGSMSEEQSNLASNFQKFTQIADLWSTNYHIGVVTTDMADAKQTGKLQADGSTHVVTPKTANGPGVLVKLAKQGTNGSGDEQGLGGAEAALSLPHIYDSVSKACKADADCKQDGGFCIPNADDPATLMCGGTNRTFLRKYAGLEVIVLSDEEDSSSATPNYYTNFFYSIKGFANKNLFHLHAIVGDHNTGCKSASGDAQAGERYIEVAKTTGGKVASICDPDFAKALKEIGSVAFGLAQQFFLTRNPEPSTIVVKVNGKVCAKTTYTYDAPSNSVIFPETSACMPQKGDKISIYYKMLCFP